jgi:hypothetical protein
MRVVSIIAACALGLLASACADRTGNMTIADWCAQDASRANTDICKQHHDTETLGARVAEVFGLTHHAQDTADQAMARNVQCVTRTLRRVQEGACDPGYTLTSCTQTHYGRRAGGMAILRTINDTQCHYNQRVLEVQVRCCAMGPNLPPATMVTDTQPPAPQAPPPQPVS